MIVLGGPARHLWKIIPDIQSWGDWVDDLRSDPTMTILIETDDLMVATYEEDGETGFYILIQDHLIT